MNIYLAADYIRRDEMRGCRDILTALGYKVVSRWIDNDDSVEAAGIGGRQITEANIRSYSEFAQDDYDDLQDADTVIMFTTGKLSRGGRHVELGIAIGLRKQIVVIGPREHVFHCTPEILHFLTWRAFVINFSRGWNG